MPRAPAAGSVFRVPDVIFALCDLFEAAASDDAVWLGLGDGLVFGGVFEGVVFFDEQPIRFALVCSFATHANQGPAASHLGAVEGELERTCTKTFIDIGMAGLRIPGALVPEHDGAASVLTLWDDAFETTIFHRVIFYLHGKALVCSEVAGALGDGPTFKNAVPAEAKVVVQM